MKKTTSLEGYYARTDGFGRLYFDKCATDEEHLLNTKIAPGDDRPRCRVYADALLPDNLMSNLKRAWVITIDEQLIEEYRLDRLDDRMRDVSELSRRRFEEDDCG